jgi:hypothetical protein
MRDEVAVTTDQAQYTRDATIHVALTNHGAAAVRVADHQSDCTAARIEAWDGKTWKMQAPCRLMRPTRLHTIEPGAVLAESVRPPADGSAAGWPAGTYRAACAYFSGPDGAEAEAHSTPFTIG